MHITGVWVGIGGLTFNGERYKNGDEVTLDFKTVREVGDDFAPYKPGDQPKDAQPPPHPAEEPAPKPPAPAAGRSPSKGRRSKKAKRK